jgi:hypothetical protein
MRYSRRIALPAPGLVLPTAALTAEQAADRVVELVMSRADYGTSPNSAAR